MAQIEGGCLCGKVRFQLEDAFHRFHFCHCTQCQKATGSAHASNLFTHVANIRWVSGREYIKRYDVPGRVISSAFCAECGSALPYLSKDGESLVVPAGALDTRPSLSPQGNIFWSERAEWYDDGLRAPRYAGFPGE
jgi:hypothetical protein